MENAPALWPERAQLGIEANSYFEMGGTTYFYGWEQRRASFIICHFPEQ